MKLVASVLLALFVTGTFVAGLPTSEDTTELPVATIHKKTTTTTTPKPQTTTTTTTTTTTEPKTTTVETSTISTSSEAPKSTSSTVAPVTTSSVAPKTSSTTNAPKPTTPAPKPSDKPEQGTWKLMDTDTKEICIIVQLAAQLNITYTTNDNKQNRTTYNIPVEDTSVPIGNCANETTDGRIVVTWPAKSLNKTNSFVYTFGLKGDKKTYYLKEAAYGIFAGDLYNGNNDSLELVHDGSDYATLKGYSYHCTKEQQLNLTETKADKTSVVGSVHVSHVQLQAFYSSKAGNFATAIDCESSGAPDYVPIAVGISLIALVVIVLIGYLVGRRRAQASGYVSM